MGNLNWSPLVPLQWKLFSKDLTWKLEGFIVTVICIQSCIRDIVLF
jgi:hypothetical protein